MSRILYFLGAFLMVMSTISAQNIRPIRDNVGFCWRADEMDKLINWLDENVDGDENPVTQNPVAGFSPHDDYLYAAKVYYPLYKMIKTKEVVIFGVTHGTVRKAMNDPQNVLILDDYDLWQGPYGNVEISPLRELIKSKLDTNYYMISDKAQSIEHSIEALIPFLQHYNRNVKITPVMITRMPYDRMEKISDDLTKIITDYIKANNLKLGKDIFFLISNDADHYGEDFNNAPFGTDEEAHRKATENDKRIAAETFNGIITEKRIKNITNELWIEVTDKDVCPLWCGRYPTVFGLLTINKVVNEITNKNLEGKVLKYSDTWTEGVIPLKGTHMGTTAPFSLKHWVGFVSAAFWIE